MFKNKILVITGGTGSFGNAVLSRFLDSDISEIRIFSRDEKKQDDMRKKYSNTKIKFYIGDVRDKSSILEVTNGADYLFHAAALKQVPSCEFYPMEAFATNVQGTANVLDASIENKLKKVICLSTDKAVYPINAMGISKAMMEKVMIAKSRVAPKGTTICATRYGNVIASRGSVIPLFIKQILEGIPITITDPEMTRFMMSLEEAVDLVLHAFKNARNGDIFVSKSPAAKIGNIANALIQYLQVEKHKINIIGTRHGEKAYEALCSREEMFVAEDQNGFFRIPADNRNLNYEMYFEKGNKEISQISDYNSSNTTQLSEDDLISIYKKLRISKDSNSS